MTTPGAARWPPEGAAALLGAARRSGGSRRAGYFVLYAQCFFVQFAYSASA